MSLVAGYELNDHKTNNK